MRTTSKIISAIVLVASPGASNALGGLRGRKMQSCASTWDQCGGSNYAGPTCCEAGSSCVVQSEWYSQCTPAGSPSTPPPVPSPTTTGNKVCQSTGAHAGYTDSWCNINCNHINPNCPQQYCSCTSDSSSIAPAPTPSSSSSYTVVSGDSCYSIAQNLCGSSSKWDNVLCDQSSTTCASLAIGQQIQYNCGGCSGGSAPASAPQTMSGVKLTFYGYPDNDPASAQIAYGGSAPRHSQAGGKGTYEDPVTLASDKREIDPGTRVYIPTLQKYFIMEDYCEECISDWDNSQMHHFDLWIGGDGQDNEAVLDCEDQLTPSSSAEVILNPAPGKAVNTSPFYTSSGGCCKDCVGM